VFKKKHFFQSLGVIEITPKSSPAPCVPLGGRAGVAGYRVVAVDVKLPLTAAVARVETHVDDQVSVVVPTGIARITDISIDLVY
jgi:hypothetical protein